MGGTTSFGYWVRRRRLALDLTQAALARRVGCSTAAVKKIEHDERRPSRTMAEHFADALGIPPDQRPQFIAAGLARLSADRMGPATGASGSGSAPAWVSSPVGGTADQLAGRGAELDRLRGHLDAALDGRPRAVFLSGEAGQGKTALLTAFADMAQRAVPELVVARGAGTATAGYGDPFLAVRDVFRMLVADPRAGWQVDQLTSAQAANLWAFAPDVARVVEEVGPRLIDVLVPADTIRERLGRPVAAPMGHAARDHVVSQVVDVLDVLARQRPLLIMLDDMQWADTASAELLFHLARRLTAARVLAVCAYRGSEVAESVGAPAAVLRRTVLEIRRDLDDALIDLDGLAPDAERRLCDAIVDLEIPGLTAEAHDELYRRTRGHPLFVQELVRELKAAGDLVDDGCGTWAVRPGLDWNRVPARVAAVVEQRLYRLDERERALLDAAAVEGEYFTAELAARVAGVTGVDERTALRMLDRLERVHGLVRDAGVLRIGGRYVSRYRFGHALIQRFVYDSLADGARRHSHGDLAEALEEMHADDPEPVVPQLAHHHAEAGHADRAIPYLLQAGDYARLLHAQSEAMAAYTRAAGFLRELGDRERLARTLMKIGLTHQTSFDHERAQPAFDEAFALWAAVDGTAAGRPAGSATLRVLWREPESLDPTMGGYTIAAPVVTNLFSGLVRYDEGTDVVPDVARRWEISGDGRRYTFELRDDAVWSDDTPVTAHDFVFTYRRALDPATGAKVAPALLDAVTAAPAIRRGDAPPEEAGIRALDDHTLVIELTEPTSYFIYNLAYYVLLPVPRHAVERYGERWVEPDTLVTNGPFRLTAWEPEGAMVLERTDRYHGPARGNVQRVTLDLATGPADHHEAYLADEVDLLSTAWFTSQATVGRLRHRYPDEYSRRERFVTVYYWLDPTRPPMDDLRFRQGMAMAVDREALAATAEPGMWRPATGGLVPPGMPGHVPGLAARHDAAAAARLVTEATGDGEVPEVTVLTSARSEPIARRLQADWSATGLPVRIEVLESSTDPFGRWTQIDGPRVGVGGWVADYPDPDTFLRVNVELDLPEWRHGRYSALLDRAARATDPADRDAAYREAERILAAEAVVVPLAYEPEHLMLKPWIVHYPSVPVKYPGFWKDVVVGPR